MSFLNKQKESPEFLNNFLKYKRYIESGAQTTTDETYYDLKTVGNYRKGVLDILVNRGQLYLLSYCFSNFLFSKIL